MNIYQQDAVRELAADCIVMATGRRSENSLYHRLRERGVSVEMIGDATAPRGTYEATFEGHRQARKLGVAAGGGRPDAAGITPAATPPRAPM